MKENQCRENLSEKRFVVYFRANNVIAFQTDVQTKAITTNNHRNGWIDLTYHSKTLSVLIRRTLKSLKKVESVSVMRKTGLKFLSFSQ